MTRHCARFAIACVTFAFVAWGCSSSTSVSMSTPDAAPATICCTQFNDICQLGAASCICAGSDSVCVMLGGYVDDGCESLGSACCFFDPTSNVCACANQETIEGINCLYTSCADYIEQVNPGPEGASVHQVPSCP